MIKLKGGSADGRKFILLGLSEGNFGKLREGKPIFIDARELAIEHDIIICWGQTEESLAQVLIKELGLPPDLVPEKVQKATRQ